MAGARGAGEVGSAMATAALPPASRELRDQLRDAQLPPRAPCLDRRLRLESREAGLRVGQARLGAHQSHAPRHDLAHLLAGIGLGVIGAGVVVALDGIEAGGKPVARRLPCHLTRHPIREHQALQQ